MMMQTFRISAGLQSEYFGKSFVPGRLALTMVILFLLLSLCCPSRLPPQLSFACSSAQAAENPDQYEGKRSEMVASQLEGRGIEDKAVLRAMSKVPRHLFVSEDLHRLAYGDFPLPIGHGQTISQPYIVAFMTEIIQPQQNQRVLEIGTGSGYQAAVLAELVANVQTIEIIPDLARSAKNRLERLGYANVEVREGDGYHGWPEAGPFDAIVVTAAAEFIPPPLLQQLKEGGVMIIPVGSPFHVQHLMLVRKQEGRITTRKLMPVRFVPFRRAE
jgi:protein-L-isoaspartate(D-aspartate) O-methyltransferase